MNPLASLPWWVLWVVLGVTFVAVHALSFRPRREPGGAGALMRVVSSALLLAGLVLVDPAEPATVLLALAAAALAGFLSGRAAPPRTSR